MKKYTAVLFDIDNTLLNFDADEHNALVATLKYYNLPYDEETVKAYVNINDGLWHDFEKGIITKEDIKNTRFALLLEMFAIKAPVSARQINDTYAFNLSEGGVLLDGAAELCEKLTENGLSLYAVTNGIELTQKKRLKKSGLDKFFKDVFISEKVGFQKPLKEYFDYVFEHIDEKEKEKIILIGDSLSSDIKGALGAKIDCIWINAKNKTNDVCEKPTYEVKNINEIYKIIK